jgi:hypothetical protein
MYLVTLAAHMDDLPCGLFSTEKGASGFANAILDGGVPAILDELDRLNALAGRDASTFIGFTVWRISGTDVTLTTTIVREDLQLC